MLLLITLLLIACNINVNVTLAQTIEQCLFGLNLFCELLVLKFYIRGKIRYPSGQIYMDKTGIVGNV
jgi:hypothetical protein